MIYAINYANEKFRKAQRLNTKTAYKCGVDKVFSYTPQDIDIEFYEANKQVLDSLRGNGYWLWKPYFILKTLKQLDEGDWLLYVDSGAFYLKNIRIYVENLERNGKWLACQEAGYIERCYSKRDAFVYMNRDSEKYTEAMQIASGIIFIKKCNESLNLISEWLQYNKDYRIVSDSPNTCGLENYDGFVENRHDQTVLSLLLRDRENIVIDNSLFVESINGSAENAYIRVHRTNCGNRVSLAKHAIFYPYTLAIRKWMQHRILRNKRLTDFLKKIGIKKKFLYGESE